MDLGIAAVAVDGNTSGSGGPWEDAEIMHSEREDQPWWQVELTQESEIHEIVLYNRTDCCKERLSDFYVLLSDEPFPSDVGLNQLLAEDSISSFFFEGAVGDSIRIPIFSEGRYVRIQLTAANEILHMAEVKVWGCPLTRTESGTGNPTGNPFEGVGGSLEESEEEEEPALTIYPNPIASHEAINAQVRLPREEVFQLTLYDYQGKVSYQHTQELDGNEVITLPIINLSSGIYLFEALGGDVQLTKKVQVR